MKGFIWAEAFDTITWISKLKKAVNVLFFFLGFFRIVFRIVIVFI